MTYKRSKTVAGNVGYLILYETLVDIQHSRKSYSLLSSAFLLLYMLYTWYKVVLTFESAKMKSCYFFRHRVSPSLALLASFFQSRPIDFSHARHTGYSNDCLWKLKWAVGFSYGNLLFKSL